MHVKFDFLNWRPDAEDLRNQGLITADNLLHDTEGYKEVSMPTAGAINATETALDAMVRPIGTAGELVYARVIDASSTTASLSIGPINGAAFTTVTLPTLTNASAMTLDHFAVAEFDQQFVISAQVTASLLAGGTTTIALSGTGGYSITSV